MDGKRFDDITKSIANRRGFLKGLTGAAAGLLGAKASGVLAACRPGGYACQRDADCCSAKCYEPSATSRSRVCCTPTQTDAQICAGKVCGTYTNSCGQSISCGTCRPSTNICVQSVTCDAQGQCVPTNKPNGTDCGDCKTCQNGTCTYQCTGDQTCCNDTCKFTTGHTCTADSQCCDGHCADGVCCKTACTGRCERCNVEGNLGSCTGYTNGTAADTPPTGQICCNGEPCYGECSATSGACICTPENGVCDVNQDCCNGVTCVSGKCCGGVTKKVDIFAKLPGNEDIVGINMGLYAADCSGSALYSGLTGADARITFNNVPLGSYCVQAVSTADRDCQQSKPVIHLNCGEAFNGWSVIFKYCCLAGQASCVYGQPISSDKFCCEGHCCVTASQTCCDGACCDGPCDRGSPDTTEDDICCTTGLFCGDGAHGDQCCPNTTDYKCCGDAGCCAGQCSGATGDECCPKATSFVCGTECCVNADNCCGGDTCCPGRRCNTAGTCCDANSFACAGGCCDTDTQKCCEGDCQPLDFCCAANGDVCSCEPDCPCTDATGNPINEGETCNGYAEGVAVCFHGYCVFATDKCGENVCAGDDACEECVGGNCVLKNQCGPCGTGGVCIGEWCYGNSGAANGDNCSVDGDCCSENCCAGTCIPAGDSCCAPNCPCNDGQDNPINQGEDCNGGVVGGGGVCHDIYCVNPDFICGDNICDGDTECVKCESPNICDTASYEGDECNGGPPGGGFCVGGYCLCNTPCGDNCCSSTELCDDQSFPDAPYCYDSCLYKCGHWESDPTIGRDCGNACGSGQFCPDTSTTSWCCPGTGPIGSDNNNCAYCGDVCPAGTHCSGGACVSNCVPLICSDPPYYGYQCGTLGDGCSGTISCTCPVGQVCKNGYCAVATGYPCSNPTDGVNYQCEGAVCSAGVCTTCIPVNSTGCAYDPIQQTSAACCAGTCQGNTCLVG